MLEISWSRGLTGATTSRGQMNRLRPHIYAGRANVQKCVPPCARLTRVAEKATRNVHASFGPPLSECTRCTYNLGNCVQVGTHMLARIRLLPWGAYLAQTAEQLWHTQCADPSGQQSYYGPQQLQSWIKLGRKGRQTGGRGIASPSRFLISLMVFVLETRTASTID